MMQSKNKKAQSTVEYILLLAAIVGISYVMKKVFSDKAPTVFGSLLKNNMQPSSKGGAAQVEKYYGGVKETAVK